MALGGEEHLADYEGEECGLEEELQAGLGLEF